MAYSYISSSSVVYGNGTFTLTPTIPSHQTDDLLILVVGAKYDTATFTTPSGWTLIGTASGGVSGSGNDQGPTKTSFYFTIATSGSTTNPSTDVVANVGGAQVHVIRGTGGVPSLAFVGGADTTTGTPHEVAFATNPGLTVDDFLLAQGVIPTDVSTPSQFSLPITSAPGMSIVSMTEIVEWDSALANDFGGWAAYGTVLTGTATGAPTTSVTATGTTTNVAGAIGLLRVTEATAKSASDTSSIAISDSGNKKDGIFQGGSSDKNILFVVNDDGAGIAQSANDTTFKSTMEGRGHTVTYHSELSNLPGSGYDVVVISESGSSGSTAITSADTSSLPVVMFETTWNNLRLTTAAATSSTSSTQVDLQTHEITDGLADPLTYLSSAASTYGVATSALASGATSVAKDISVSTHNFCIAVESGDNLTSGTAPARRVAMGLLDSRVGSLTTAGYDLTENAIIWAGGGAGEWIFPEDKAGSDTASLAISDASEVIVLDMKNASDTGSLAISDGSAIVTIESIAGTDTASLAISEVSDVDSIKVLPGSIAGIEPESHGYVPPFMDSNGNIYRVTESLLAENNQPKLMKSTDGGQTWTEQDAANRPGTDTSSIGDLESGWLTWNPTSKIATFTWQRSFVAYSSFRTSDHPTNPDTWVSNTRENMASLTGSPQYASHTSPQDQSYEWVFYNNSTTKPSYRSRSGAGSYGTQADVDSTGQHPATIIDVDNVSHILYTKSSELHYKKLTSGGTLDSSSTRVDANGLTSTPIAHAAPQVYKISSDKYVGALFCNSSNHLKFVLITNGTPGSEETITTTAVMQDPDISTNQASIISLAVHGTTLHALWSDSATGNVMHSQRPHGGAWSSPDTLVTISGTDQAQWVYGRVMSYPTGETVLGYTYDIGPHGDDAGAIKYNELLLESATPKAGSESNSLAISESAVLDKFTTTTDTGSLAVSETTESLITVSTTDTGSLAISESTETTAIFSASDSGSVAISESTELVVVLNATDSGSLAIAEAMSLDATSSVSDTASVAISETTVIDVTVSVSDTSSIAISETAQAAVMQSASDTGAVAISETQSSDLSTSVTDTGSLAISETTEFDRAIDAADTASVAIAEQTAIDVTLSASDTASLAITDSSEASVVVNVSDTASLAVSETQETLASLTTTDSATIAVDETILLFKDISASDTGSLAVSDSSEVTLIAPGTDTSSISISEFAEIEFIGEVTKNGSDTASVAISETTLIDVTIATSDTSGLVITESQQSNIVVIASDNASVAISESTSIFNDMSTTDSATVSVSDTSETTAIFSASDTGSVSISEGTDIEFIGEIAKNGTDTGSLASSETSSVDVMIVASDTNGLSITETQQSDIQVSTVDSATVAISESILLVKEISSSDSSSIAVSDDSAVTFIAPGADTSSIAISESTDIEVFGTIEKSASDSGSLAIAESVSQNVLITRTDTSTVSVSESTTSDITVSRSDTGSITITDVGVPLLPFAGSDTFAIAISEDSDVFAQAGTLNVNASDSSSVNILEFRILKKPHDQNTIIHSESETTMTGSLASETKTAIIVNEHHVTKERAEGDS